MRSNVFLSMILVLAVLALSGCSGQKQVKGKVTLKDGTPLTNGRVVFEKEGFSARGEIQSDGTYVMGTVKNNDGVPKGEYVVYITGATKNEGNVDVKVTGADMKPTTISMPSLESMVSKKHSSSYTSDIKCKVDKSMTFDFSVDPAE